MTMKVPHTSVHSKSVLTPLLLAFLPSLSETRVQPVRSSWRGVKPSCRWVTVQAAALEMGSQIQFPSQPEPTQFWHPSKLFTAQCHSFKSCCSSEHERT